jgi:hypothetical protein
MLMPDFVKNYTDFVNKNPAAPSALPDPKAGVQLQFTPELSKTLFIYRVGIGELTFNPLNTQISENISMNNEIQTDIYGKTNPFVSYTNTIRSYNFSFTLNAVRPFNFYDDAKKGEVTVSDTNMMQLVNILKSFLYANYDRLQDSGNKNIYARTIKSPPIFKIKFKNLVSNGTEDLMAKNSGLLGAMKDFKLEPFYNAGYVPFGSGERVATYTNNPVTDLGTYSEMKISFNFYPIFEQPLGWEVREIGKERGFSGVDELGGASSANAIKNILG